ncbi:Vi polysaccharide biosynthesis protein VipA/TviB [Rhodobacter veldkampii DSM 11550]|uniref:Vi polysaccharide biosynthesis protein VipA/TviB n=1 Tax=Phaeovulum veldkampii DSM 11550 TaxID=1185920 RepID=A0A2T4J943_9RHOB|nr:nucleotide sugar dehydrogenase [Phaeovulum veldkampii]MBK5945383.1 Vi polysaccharide biosynthesis protein VipA/TviB [Phaeovulum veldkampii DSM 11550]PTE14425.1 Vi polysaccharide biosynthesis protein VipA/TviB [Phaeovulum veldkampii DSM 11550]TDQ54556.1 UDP-N-acetyl-D-galactosamine dehydrogenase [Phaeovulum veldkampii DSM 11550]
MNRIQDTRIFSDAVQLPAVGNLTVGVIGLGYVGLPLAAAFGKKIATIGFDINIVRVEQLSSGLDITGELDCDSLKQAERLRFSASERDLLECDVLIVAVPTPITKSRTPDLQPLLSASEVVGRCIRKGGIVIYESTVYPGATEEDCIPVIERISGLRYNIDFFAGYSPERINPGDKDRPISKIVKVTSGSTPEVADFVDELYGRIIEAGTFKASSIRVAEASKIIENTQRDVNIALINELSIVFSNLGIDTNEVLDAAATKWNFIRLRPGLVGGHCIGVDPYYLVHKSMATGFIPDMIRTAREINDGMARNAVVRLVTAMVARNMPVKGARVLVVGFNFKENCPDTRNTKVVELVSHIRAWGMEPEIVDPWADQGEVLEEYGLPVGASLPDAAQTYDAVILAVPHTNIVAQGAGRLRGLLRPGGVLFDMKAAFDIADSDLRL